MEDIFNPFIFNYGENSREGLYLMEEFQQILTTFAWGADKNPPELIEKYLRSKGCCAFGRSNPSGLNKGEVVPFSPAFGGPIGIDGLGTEISGVTLNGEYITGTRGKDIAVVFNCSTYMPDMPFLRWYAEMFSETDKSIRSNLLMSRLMPLGLAADEQSKKAIEAAYKKVLDGDLYAIAKINKIIDEEGFKTADITNIDNITKIQYLSKFYDDLTRRLYVKYGIPISSNAKMAQTNSEELVGYEFYSQIYLNDCLEMRKRGVDEINSIFGTEWTVELSKPFSRSNEVALGEEEKEEEISTETPEEVTEEVTEKEQDNTEEVKEDE